MKIKLCRNFSPAVYCVAGLLLVAANLFIFASHAAAAQLTNSYIRETNMNSTGTADLRVVFKTTATSGAGNITGLTIAFNNASDDTTTWTGGGGSVAASGYSSVTGTSGCDVSATALPGTLSASGASGTITISGISGAAASTLYCLDIQKSGAAVTNPSAGQYHPIITEVGASSPLESTTVDVDVISNDQVTVNAVVPPSFSFAIGCASNTDNFQANLDTSHVITTGGCTVTVNTNAKNGWYAWADDTHAGLSSTSAGHTISWTSPGGSSPSTISNGTEGYVMAVSADNVGSGGGALTVANQFGNNSGGVATACTSGTSTSCTGDGLNGTATVVISSNGTASSTTFTTQERATISATTQAGTDYTDTYTLIGAGYF